MKKLRGAFEVPILIAAAFAAVLIALGVGYKAGNTNVEYEGNLWCVSNYIQKEPTEYTKDGRPVKHPLLNDRGDWIRKDQIEVDPSTDNPQEEAITLATKAEFFERATKEEMVAALEKGDKEFFTHHFNATATSAGPCWGTGSSEDKGKWINDAIREECLGTGSDVSSLVDNVISGKCGDLQNPNAISAQDIKTFLEKNGSPMKNDANAFIEAAQKYKINPAFMLGISAAESSFGKAGAGKSNMNPGNVKTSSSTLRAAGISFRDHDTRGHVMFSSWRDGIMGMAEVLRRNYFNKGRDNLSKIASIYLKGNKQGWINNITAIIKQICKN